MTQPSELVVRFVLSVLGPVGLSINIRYDDYDDNHCDNRSDGAMALLLLLLMIMVIFCCTVFSAF